MVVYSNVQDRSIKDVPCCDVFVTGPLCATLHPLGKRKGTLASQGRLLFQSLQYIVEKIPRAVIIENVRGFTFKRMQLCWTTTRNDCKRCSTPSTSGSCALPSPPFCRVAAGATWWASAGRRSVLSGRRLLQLLA